GPRNLRRADDGPVRIPEGRDRQRNGDSAAVLGPTQRFEVVDLLTATKPSEHVLLFGAKVVWNDQKDMLADSLSLRVPEQLFRASIPRGNDAIQRLADNGIVRRVHNGRQPRTERVDPLSLADVARNLRCADDRAVGVFDWRYGQRYGDAATMLRLPHRLEMIDFLTAAKPGEHVLLFGATICRNDQENVLA